MIQDDLEFLLDIACGPASSGVGPLSYFPYRPSCRHYSDLIHFFGREILPYQTLGLITDLFIAHRANVCSDGRWHVGSYMVAGRNRGTC